MGMEATSFSEQALAARHDYFASGVCDGRSWVEGIVDAILVGQDVRDVGDVVEKFTGHASRVPGRPPAGDRQSQRGAPRSRAVEHEHQRGGLHQSRNCPGRADGRDDVGGSLPGSVNS